MNHATVVWITGRPASGKSTFGGYLASLLRADGVPCALLDGDEVRDALGRVAGRGPEERDAFYEALARLAALLARQGLSVIVPATAHRRAYRERARSLAPRFIEVHVATPLDECARRDPKGLYALAREGAAVGLPGVDEPFEDPVAPDVIALDGEDERALAHALALLRLARGCARAVRPGRRGRSSIT
jgi:adenylylsulfate kinase